MQQHVVTSAKDLTSPTKRELYMLLMPIVASPSRFSQTCIVSGGGLQLFQTQHLTGENCAQCGGRNKSFDLP